ncbi:FAD-binding oxidoreductase [Taylorella equigenitalis]|uniref:FAD-dependent oxidoreductase n=1 Tax=Taylorella equigenitalis TaxID=29575 RepID=UPI0003FBB903|nr:FAD-dependent oxidoreductase [Taylorella equigenitalis]WDU47577.1 FAD-binding oxidoreductase [Taylorella equigenitalis]
MHIGIAGAGLVGRLLSYLLTSEGHDITIFDVADSESDPRAAGFTAAGMLSHIAEIESGDRVILDLGLRSLELWKAIVPSLSSPVELHYSGGLILAHQGDYGVANRLVSLLQKKAPADQLPLPLTLDELHKLEPDVHGVAHAWMLRNEGHIHTRQAMQALYASCTNIYWRWQTPVKSLSTHKITTEKGDTYEFDWVFDARGVGAREFKHPNSHSISCNNVRGVRGEVIWLQIPGLRLSRPIRLIHPRYRVYIVHRQPDILFVGASEIESEDRSPISVRTMVELLTAAHSVLPDISEARIIHTETNLRPATLDNLPRIETEDGITRVNGLFRHGWLIAPAVVEDALKPLLGRDYSIMDTISKKNEN